MDFFTEYHKWYYNTEVWKRQYWRGVEVQKFIFDVWNYQEIIFDLKPDLILEIGTYKGGSALMFHDLLRNVNKKGIVVTVDISHELSKPNIDGIKGLKLLEGDSISLEMAKAMELYIKDSGRVFAILDGNHQKEQVFKEMVIMNELLKEGDYLVVEDGNINGNPVLPGWGAGPKEAIDDFFRIYPDSFKHDYDRERKFRITCAPEGYLIKL